MAWDPRCGGGGEATMLRGREQSSSWAPRTVLVYCQPTNVPRGLPHRCSHRRNRQLLTQTHTPAAAPAAATGPPPQQALAERTCAALRVVGEAGEVIKATPRQSLFNVWRAQAVHGQQVSLHHSHRTGRPRCNQRPLCCPPRTLCECVSVIAPNEVQQRSPEALRAEVAPQVGGEGAVDAASRHDRAAPVPAAGARGRASASREPDSRSPTSRPRDGRWPPDLAA